MFNVLYYIHSKIFFFFLGLANIILVFIDVRYQNFELELFVHKTRRAEFRELDIMFALTANTHESVVLKTTETKTLTYLLQY